MATGQLNIAHVVGSQNNKETTINAGLDALDNASNKISDLTITGNRTLTAAELRGNAIFELSGTPGNFTLTVPASIARTFIVSNRTGSTCSILTNGSSADALDVATLTAGSFYTDGTDTRAVASGSGSGGEGGSAVSVSHNGVEVLAEILGLNFIGGAIYENSDGGIDVALGSATGGTVQSEVAASRDIENTDLLGNRVIKANSASAIAFTVVAGLTGNEPLTVIRTGAGAVSFAPESGVDIRSAGGDLVLASQYSAATLIPDLANADTYFLVGDLTT